MISEFERLFRIVFLYAAGSALLFVVIGAAIMLGLSIYDVWQDRRKETK